MNTFLLLLIQTTVAAATNYDCTQTTGSFELTTSCITTVPIKVQNSLTITGLENTLLPLRSISGASDHQIFVVETKDILTLSHVELTLGKSNSGGGAVSVLFNGVFNAQFLVFSFNTGATSGGAVEVGTSATTTIMGSVFKGNQAKQGNDVYISTDLGQVFLVNNEYSNGLATTTTTTATAQNDVDGFDSVIQQCAREVTSTSSVCKKVNDKFLDNAACISLTPLSKGIQCTPNDTPVVHAVGSDCQGDHASLSTPHAAKGCDAKGGNTLLFTGTGFGLQKGTVQIRVTVGATPSTCSVVDWTNSAIKCTLPAIVGVHKQIVVTNVVSGKTNINGVQTLGRELYGAAMDSVSCDPPSIASYTTGEGGSHLNTVGGQSITLIGRHFGTDPSTTRSLLMGENTWRNTSSELEYVKYF